MLCWALFQGLIVAPLFTLNRAAVVTATLCVELAVAFAMLLLQRGRLRAAGAIYLFVIWMMASTLIMLDRGNFSVGIVYYMMLPVTGAWLFGLRTAVVIAGFSAGTYLYIPETPVGAWTMIVAATILSTGPVAVAVQIMTDSLSKYQSVQAAMRRDQAYLEELVRLRTLELLKARDQADAARRAKRVFLANMSHELLTPLNAILGFSTLVRGGPGLSERQCKELEIISHSSEHLLNLVERVLDSSNSEEAAGQPGISYNYGKRTPSRSARKGTALTPEALSVLPEELCGELEAALILLDVDRVTALIQHIAETYPALGRTLEDFSDNLAYTSILRAIEARKVSLVEVWP
jgi:signal transduction histidine kinase